MNDKQKENPLGSDSVAQLLYRFAVPSIIAMLVSALYNIVDQFFIGRNVGALGNAATNIAFPLSISCVAAALLFGIGGASAFNIALGEGESRQAAHYIGNAILMIVCVGTGLTLVSEVFMEPLLRFFGSPENVLDYAILYTRITAIGFPFLMLGTGGGHLIRADGNPKMTMICNLTGAAINTFLDYLFVSVLQWGMTGAALATVIGQVISAGIAVQYFFHFRTIEVKWEHLVPKWCYVRRVISLGVAPCTNQLAMMLVQIVMNKTLKYYGGRSAYGEAIPIACSGIIAKVNMIYMSFIIGISQGMQPIASFNYGAKQYDRVKKTYRLAVSIGALLSVGAFLVFQFAPRQIISLFGNGEELYYQFATQYFHIFLFFTFVNFLQPISSNFFTAIGKPMKGAFLSLTRQTLFLLPLLLLLPLFLGMDGVLYAGPIADATAAVVTVLMIVIEFRKKEFRGCLPQKTEQKRRKI